jgi:type I restriction enzyme M protein
MVAIMQPKKDESICDPACGTAGFLISSYKHILNENTKKNKGDLLTPDERKKLINNFVGYDISSEMVRLSLVNMYLHGFTTPKIYEYDTLTSTDRWGDTFDIIMANPPFMTPKGGIRPHKKFAMQANRSEVLFVDYIMEHINPTTGRAAVIVPEGIIFQSATAYKALRKLLVEKNFLYGVVSLPAGLFQPYSGVKTSILLLDKTLAKKTDKILFVKIENDGYSLGAQRKELPTSDLPDATNFIKQYISAIRNDDFSLIDFEHLPLNSIAVERSRITDNGDYNLSGDRYKINTTRKHSKFELVTLGDVCNFTGGFAFKSSELLDEFKDDCLPVVKIGNLHKDGFIDLEDVQYFEYNESLKKYRILKDDILIAMTGATVGKVAISNEDNMLLNQRVGLIRANEDLINKDFLKSLLLSEKFYEYCQFTAGGGAQGNISPTEIMNFKFPLPDLTFQEIISRKISNANKIIAGAKQVVENYIPQIDIKPDWEMVELGKIIKLSSGRGLTQQNMIEGEFPVYGGNGINGYHNEYFIENPIIVIGRVGAYCGSVIVTQPKSWVTDNGLYITEYLMEINQDYLAQVLSQLELNKFAKVGGQPSISQSTVYERQIPVPTIAEQELIVAQIEKEQQLVNMSKELVKIFEQKIKDEINKLWEE